MSSRSLRNANSLDLNVQGLAMGVQQMETGDIKTDVHTMCRREIERLKRELTTEKSNYRKLKSSLSDLKLSRESSESEHMKTISLLKVEHDEQIEKVKNDHVKVLTCLHNKHKEEIDSLQCKHKLELEKEQKKTRDAGLELDKQKENYENIISSKAEQVGSLKQQVAESFEINSKERHQQIDELMKELQTVSEEAAYLKGIVQSSNFSKCQKCSFYENKYKELAIEVSTRDENYKTLFEICSKMEKQLSQQDELCVMLASLKEKIES